MCSIFFYLKKKSPHPRRPIGNSLSCRWFPFLFGEQKLADLNAVQFIDFTLITFF